MNRWERARRWLGRLAVASAAVATIGVVIAAAGTWLAWRVRFHEGDGLVRQARAALGLSSDRWAAYRHVEGWVNWGLSAFWVGGLVVLLWLAVQAFFTPSLRWVGSAAAVVALMMMVALIPVLLLGGMLHAISWCARHPDQPSCSAVPGTYDPPIEKNEGEWLTEVALSAATVPVALAFTWPVLMAGVWVAVLVVWLYRRAFARPATG